jgi:hypothetical protein
MQEVIELPHCRWLQPTEPEIQAKALAELLFRLKPKAVFFFAVS